MFRSVLTYYGTQDRVIEAHMFVLVYHGRLQRTGDLLSLHSRCSFYEKLLATFHANFTILILQYDPQIMESLCRLTRCILGNFACFL